MRAVRVSRTVGLPLPAAAALWADVSRWSTFVEGFAHEISKDPGWPEEGAKLVWESVPGGRGRVTERVLVHDESHHSTRLLEESLSGVQTATFEPAEGDATFVTLSLEYQLNPTSVWRQGPLGKVTDVLFIRRALSDSLARTLRRFATEAHEQASL